MLIVRYFGRRCVRLLQYVVIIASLLFVASMFLSPSKMQNALVSKMGDVEKMGMIIAKEDDEHAAAIVKDDEKQVVAPTPKHKISGYFSFSKKCNRFLLFFKPKIKSRVMASLTGPNIRGWRKKIGTIMKRWKPISCGRVMARVERPSLYRLMRNRRNYRLLCIKYQSFHVRVF